MKLFDIFKSSRGFTFIEILATLTFAAIVLPVAMKGISLATVAASESKKRSEATLLAQNLLAETVAADTLDFSSISGDFLPEIDQYRWTAELSDWENGNLKELIVKIFWQTHNKEQSIALTTLVYTGEQ